MKVIQAPARLPRRGEGEIRSKGGRFEVIPVMFLAGGITGTENWQKQFIEMLGDVNVTIINPRREIYINSPKEAKRQIKWEFNAFEYVLGCSYHPSVSFWFPKSSICPIALFELGKMVMADEIRLYIGCEPGYARELDIQEQVRLARPEVEVDDSLDGLASRILCDLSLRKSTADIMSSPYYPKTGWWG